MKKFLNTIKKVVNRLIVMYKRQDHIAFARSLGVKIGENCRLVDNPMWGSEPYLISLGDHVLVSGEVTFLTHDGATFLFREEGPYKDTYKFGPIRIGNNCFIGHRSMLLPNVTIGDNCIIAAGSVVTKNVPTGEVWGGVPAKFITTTEAYARKCYENRLPYDVEQLHNNQESEMKRLFHIE